MPDQSPQWVVDSRDIPPSVANVSWMGYEAPAPSGDTTGVTDTAALIAADTAAKAAGLPLLLRYAPSSAPYWVTGGFTPTTDWTTLVGRSQCWIKRTATGSRIFDLNAATGIDVHGFSYDGNRGGTALTGPHFRTSNAADRCRFYDLYMQNTPVNDVCIELRNSTRCDAFQIEVDTVGYGVTCGSYSGDTAGTGNLPLAVNSSVIGQSARCRIRNIRGAHVDKNLVFVTGSLASTASPNTVYYHEVEDLICTDFGDTVCEIGIGCYGCSAFDIMGDGAGNAGGAAQVLLLRDNTGTRFGNIFGVNLAGSPVTSVTSTASNFTITTSQPHGFQAGYSITLGGFTPAGYNGTFTIASVTTYTITVTSALNPGNATVMGTFGSSSMHAQGSVVNLAPLFNAGGTAWTTANAATILDCQGGNITGEGGFSTLQAKGFDGLTVNLVTAEGSSRNVYIPNGNRLTLVQPTSKGSGSAGIQIGDNNGSQNWVTNFILAELEASDSGAYSPGTFSGVSIQGSGTSGVIVSGESFDSRAGGSRTQQNGYFVDSSCAANVIVGPLAKSSNNLSTDSFNGSNATQADIQLFTANGTWTKPSWATKVQVLAVGAGGGGGSGAVTASGSVGSGGGGGGGGSYSAAMFQAAELSATVAVTVGTGGTGGTASSTTTHSGVAGNQGTANSAFGAYLKAGVGFGGGAGQISAAGTSGSGGGGAVNGGSGAASSATGAVGNPGSTATQGAGGGGSGGGIATTPASVNGGNGGTNNTPGPAVASGGAGIGPNGNVGNADANLAVAGSAGAGGASNSSGNGFAGGNGGAYGGGGGGGGACLNGSTSGAGGNGANGFLVAISS